MNTFDILSNAPEGATHYHPKNDEWESYYLKVDDEEQKVFMWLELIPNCGHWNDIPVYDEDAENYIKLGDITND